VAAYLGLTAWLKKNHAFFQGSISLTREALHLLLEKQAMPLLMGLAWLGLAAERHQPSFQDSFDAAWYQASVEDRIEAKSRHKELKSKYGDKIALQRARRRFEEEKRKLRRERH
jgi:hypothetical protein